MTLITYPTRVHFADDVLEEALHSELERGGYKAPLLVLAQHPSNPELEDRVRAGLPTSVKPSVLTYADASDLRALVGDVSNSGSKPDSIIAFGAARAIELARKCRYALRKGAQPQLPLFAIPGIDGLPGPCTRNLESWRAGLPSVLICDPTVTLGVDDTMSVRASILSLVRCCESYLASAYNPPADGMALDGLHRSVTNLPKIGKSAGVDLHRELMAASLNAALSQEKGIGPTLAMASALLQQTDDASEAEIARVLLPGVIRAQDVKTEKADALCNVLGLQHLPLDQAMQGVLGKLNAPNTLAGLGILRKNLGDAARAASATTSMRYETARTLLDAVYEEAAT